MNEDDLIDIVTMRAISHRGKLTLTCNRNLKRSSHVVLTQMCLREGWPVTSIEMSPSDKADPTGKLTRRRTPWHAQGQLLLWTAFTYVF